MKKIVLILLIFYCNIASASTSYEATLRELWEKVVTERDIEYSEGFLCQDIKSFFERAVDELEPGEKTLIFFYPKNCRFDRLVADSNLFIEYEEFFDLAEDYGFQISYFTSQRHLVSFQDREEMEDFVESAFQSELNREEVPLYFPSKIIIAELVRQ